MRTFKLVFICPWQSDEEEELSFAERLAVAKSGVEEAQRTFDPEEHAAQRERSKQRPTKRANKNRPQEVTSKKPVSRFIQVVKPEKKTARDPRFDHLSGNFDQAGFDKAYAFLDDYRKDEVEQLKDSIKGSKNEWEQERMKMKMSKLSAQIKSKEDRVMKQQHKSARRKKEMELVAKGKKAFYPKKSQEKQELLLEKYKKLKKDGGLKKYIEKKRQRRTTKDHKAVPFSRRDGE